MRKKKLRILFGYVIICIIILSVYMMVCLRCISVLHGQIANVAKGHICEVKKDVGYGAHF